VDWGDIPTWAGAAVAVAAAVVAWLYSRRSVAAANRSATADERAAYHLDKPMFTAEIEEVNQGGWHRLALRLDGPIDIPGRVDIELLDDSLMLRQGVDGVDRNAAFPIRKAWAQRYIDRQTPMPTREVEPGGMKIGQTVKWMVERVGKATPQRVNVLVVADAGDGRVWRSLLIIDVPGSLQSDDLGIY
jgi:hypothetical protein